MTTKRQLIHLWRESFIAFIAFSIGSYAALYINKAQFGAEIPPMPTFESLAEQERLPIVDGYFECGEEMILITLWPTLAEIKAKDYTIESLSVQRKYFMWAHYKSGREGTFLVAYLDIDGDGNSDRLYLTIAALNAEFPEPCDILGHLGLGA